MGFPDKVKKAFGSKKEDESRNSLNEEVIDKQTPNDKIRNFKYLDDLIHGDAKEIVLDSDIILSDGEESEYKDGIKLDVDDLAIDGNGHVIDAQGKTRIFFCTGKNIAIKNITLKNGFAEEDGGAIYNRWGELTITKSTLNNNTADNEGGAINNILGELTITESTLNNNTSKEEGGAISNTSGELTITESTLNNNTSKEYRGGAINNKRGELTITESTLNNNTAKTDGGAIYNNDEGSLTITKSTLTGNTSQGTRFYEGGGAIYNEEGELTIKDSTLTGNIAKEDGGAIYNFLKKSFSIKNCKLENNKPNDIN